ncbi:uncharacterized protein LOC127719118 [Mytilus californianus]|uniref:uncharacterized protein LOC127719118 n=1 Tax=Mytilus californianus TaxID=6549 RepID=UPI0022483ED5|nr:uncharacterized protein LOC127719118 [Mytilus californianus]
MLVSFVLLTVLKIHEGQCLEGLNVCEDRRSKREYCCAGYEEIHALCIECNIGFTSINGDSCTPCGNNRFGKRCLARCNCQSVERCDNVVGCVPKIEVREDAALSTQDKENSFSEAMTESVAATTKTKNNSLSVTIRDNDFAYTLSGKQFLIQ